MKEPMGNKKECNMCTSEATTSREAWIMTHLLCELCAICYDEAVEEMGKVKDYQLSEREKDLFRKVTNLSI